MNKINSELVIKTNIMNINFIKSIAIIITLSCICYQSLHGQEFEDIKHIKGGFTMNNKGYLKEDMKDLFKDSPYSMYLYKKAKKQRIIGHATLVLGTASSVYGLLLMDPFTSKKKINTNNSFAEYSNELSEMVHNVGVGFLVAGAALGTVSILKYRVSNRNYKKSLQEYGISKRKTLDTNSDDVIIKTQITGNEMGLIYQF